MLEMLLLAIRTLGKTPRVGVLPIKPLKPIPLPEFEKGAETDNRAELTAEGGAR
jgi:hypothetical protein